MLAEPLVKNTLQNLDSLLLPLRNPPHSELGCGTKGDFLRLWTVVPAESSVKSSADLTWERACSGAEWALLPLNM